MILTRKILSILAYMGVPLLLVLFSILIPTKETFLLYGSIAEYLLLFILFVKPVALVFDLSFLKTVLAYRRQLGVTTFWFALFHTVLFIYDKELYSLSDYGGFGNYLFYGLLAMIGMCVLALTSNNISARFLKRNWKRVQYLAYPTLFFTLLHSSMIREELPKFLVLTGLFILFKMLEWSGVRYAFKS